MKIGKAKNGGAKKFFNVKEGDNVFRILPPMGKLADEGKWSLYYRVEWGYKNSEGRTKLFQDPRVVNRKTGMVEVESAAHLRRELLKKKQAETAAAFKAGKASKEDLNKISELVKRFNLESKHHMNAVDLEGNIGLLKIGHKTKLALDAEMDKLRKEGIEPTSVEKGVYFVITRSGKGRDTAYSVSQYREKRQVMIDGQSTVIEQPKYHAMDDSFISRLDAEAFELSDLYPAPTAEEVEKIVKGGPEVLDSVLARYAKKAPVAKSQPVAQTTEAAAVESNLEELGLEGLDDVADLAVSTIETTESIKQEVASDQPVAQTAATEEDSLLADLDQDELDFLKEIEAM